MSPFYQLCAPKDLAGRFHGIFVAYINAFGDFAIFTHRPSIPVYVS